MSKERTSKKPMLEPNAWCCVFFRAEDAARVEAELRSLAYKIALEGIIFDFDEVERMEDEPDGELDA